MGNSSSQQQHDGDGAPHDAEEEIVDPFDGIDTLGYRVLGVQPNSPASQAGLVSFLDFLVGAEGRFLLGSGEGLQEGDEYDDVDFPALLEQYKGKPLELLVWNIKSQQERLVRIVPRSDWGGAGLLGVTIRLDNYAGAEDRLIRILSVEDKSPAAIAGLKPEKDYLLGTTHLTLDTTDTLAAILRHHMDKVVEFYVYNVDTDVVRTVALMPTLSWGGRGLLGAEVGIGYLHRLPASVTKTDGTSVERKVRYVGVKSEAKEEGAPTNGTQAVLSPNQTQGLAGEGQGAILEVEPQLEMEVGEDEDDGVEEIPIPQRSQQRQPSQPPQPQQQPQQFTPSTEREQQVATGEEKQPQEAEQEVPPPEEQQPPTPTPTPTPSVETKVPAKVEEPQTYNATAMVHEQQQPQQPLMTPKNWPAPEPPVQQQQQQQQQQNFVAAASAAAAALTGFPSPPVPMQHAASTSSPGVGASRGVLRTVSTGDPAAAGLFGKPSPLAAVADVFAKPPPAAAVAAAAAAAATMMVTPQNAPTIATDSPSPFNSFLPPPPKFHFSSVNSSTQATSQVRSSRP